MPKSDTWPGGTGLERMNGMDSAGSCDSVVSANSAFSDDSLEHLSAEERACLMFLEETIESLDTEEDSGLSNDEPEQLPSHGNLANKLADLSVSMSKSKFNGSQIHDSKELIKENVDVKPVQSYLVPTPFVLASSSIPTTKTLYSKNQVTFQNNKLDHKHNQTPIAPPVPLEVNVVIPPSTKPRDYLGRTAEGPLPRGPLSYDALVHLRRSASAKKTPLCPRIDHTIDLEMHLPAPVEGPNFGNPSRADRSHSEVSNSKISLPVVAPKPKIPANITVKTKNEGSKTSGTSHGGKHATDPQVVRLEALQKLGLLKDQEPENEVVAPLPPPKSHTSLDPTPNRFARAPSNCNPSRSPSFCYSKVPTEPKSRPLQSSASFHHGSRRDEQPVLISHPAQSSGLKTAGLKHCVTPDNQRNYPEPQLIQSATPVKITTTAQPTNSVGYTVMVVPGMGADRKEALRKLGLLKD
ncbi:specifically androgen-regulated gene protein [Stegastes partitus]|uniref:Specifically androgen-regulated gene protein n=1 Tax=Stegastes partitus TaxID=144197 RepID=A0A9Y4NVF3_9TELE|nr:PREDICTED: specifically androgen-regulated gene protein-like [Stegastes partitus]